MYGVTEEINRLKSQVALLLACSRTRMDKARWTSIQELLRSANSQRSCPPLEMAHMLAREKEYLRNLIEQRRRDW
jgi:hypothetical protein